MAIKPVPALTAVPVFPALSDRAAGTYNSKAFAFGTHMADKFNGELAAVAGNVLNNAGEALAAATTAGQAATTAVAAAALLQDASSYAESALASKQAAAQSELAAGQSATSAAQAKASVDASMAQIAGGPVVSFNGMTGIINVKVPTTGDVVVSARGDYAAPAYLPCDGGTYLRTSYPALAAMIPVTHPLNKASSVTSGPAIGRSICFSGDGGYLGFGMSTNGTAGLIFYKVYSSTTILSLGNPPSTPAGSIYGMDFSADGLRMVVASYTVSPYVRFYNRNGDNLTATNPLGTALSTTAALDAAMSRDGVYAAVATFNVGIAMYKRSVDTWTRIADVESTSGYNCVAFDPAGNYLAAGASAVLRIYKRAGDGFYILPAPSSLPTGQVQGVAFSPDGNYLAVTSGSIVIVYKRNGDTFTRLADPDVSGIGTLNDVAFSPNGQFMTIVGATGVYMISYRRIGDAFVRLGAMSPPIPGSAYGVSYSPDSSMIAVAHDGGAFISIYAVGYNPNTLFKLPTQTIDGSGLLGYIKT